MDPTQGNGVSVDLSKLGPQEMNQVKKTLESELQLMTENFGALKVAHGRFVQSLEALKDISRASANTPMLVPLTSSLYVPGTLVNHDKVLVDVGVGYFIEKDTKGAAAFITGKLGYIQKNLEKVSQTVVQKRRYLNMVSEMLNQQVQEIQSAQEASGSSSAPRTIQA